MSDDFDPYQQWLGISPRERPADNYRLLGLPVFESDPATIAAAADERMMLIRKQQTGPRGSFTQRLLNEISTARLCLLNSDTKRMYDAVLQGRFAAAAAASQPAAPHPPSYPSDMLPQASLPSPAAPLAVLLPSSAGPRSAPVAAPVRQNQAIPLARAMSAPPAPPPVHYSGPVAAPPPLPVVYNNSALAPAPATEVEEQTSWVTRRRLVLVAAAVAIAAVTWALVGRGWLANKNSVLPPGSTADANTASEEVTPESVPETSSASSAGSVLIAQEGSGQFNFPASLAEVHGETPQLDIRDDESVIAHWTSAEDWLSWQFRATKPGIFQVQVQYLAAADADGGQFELALDEDARTGDIRATPGKEFHTETLFLAVKRTGPHTLTLRARKCPGAEFMTLKAIRFEPQPGASSP